MSGNRQHQNQATLLPRPASVDPSPRPEMARPMTLKLEELEARIAPGYDLKQNKGW